MGKSSISKSQRQASPTGDPVYLVYQRDITERKIAEETLRNERNRFRTLSENAPFGIILIDKDGVFKYINPNLMNYLVMN